MSRRFLPLTVLLIALMWLPAAAQSKPDSAQFTFKPGQSVYVTAQRINGQLDTYVEERLRSAFEKQKVFQLARKISEADFVFLAYSDYGGGDLQTLTCFALLPEQYTRTKGDYDALREAAFWTDQSKNGWNQYPEPLSGRLVKKFHEQFVGKQALAQAQAAKPKPVTPASPAHTFARDEAVFVAAYRADGQRDTYIEERLKKAFETRKYFKLARSANEAGLIFLAYSKYNDEYRGKELRQLTGFALLPAQYAQTGGEYEPLREAAFWTEQLKRNTNVFLPSLPEQLSDKIVALLHEQLTTNPTATPKTVIAPPVDQPPATVQPGRRARDFQPGQTIYVVAYRLNGPVNLPVESRLGQAFEQQKFFKLTRKLSEADFIFLVYCAYEGGYMDNLTGFALTPEQYARLKGNLDALREEALWQDRMRRSWTSADEERVVDKLAQKFHDDLRAGRAATESISPQPATTSAGETPRQEASVASGQAVARDQEAKAAATGGVPSAIRSGQAVYVTAYRAGGQPDTYIEIRLQEAFEKRKQFPLARNANEADLVFLVYSEYFEGGAQTAGFQNSNVKTLTGYALLPTHYAQTKGNFDGMRDAALWSEQVKNNGTLLPRFSEPAIDRLVARFHEQQSTNAIASKPAPPSAPESPATADPLRPTTSSPAPREPILNLEMARKVDDESGRAFEKGQFDKAIALAQSALEFKEQSLGENHAELVVTLNRLASPFIARQDYKRAEALLARALSIAEKAHGDDHPQTAAALSRMASLHADYGDFVRAAPLQLRALAILEKALGPDDAQVAAALNDQAILELGLGDLTKAEPRLTRALSLQEKKIGKNAREVGHTLHNLATIYFVSGDYQRAQPLYERALGIFDGRHRALSKFITGMDKVPFFGAPKNSAPTPPPFEDRSIHVTDTLNNLATIYIRQGKLREAGELLQRAQAIERRAYGSRHPDVARTQNNYSLLYRARGDLWRALEAQRMASEVIETDLRRQLLAGSERQKQAYVERFAAQTDAALSLNLQSAPHDAEVTKAAVTSLLRYKGRGLDAMVDTLARLRRQADPESKALLERFATARAQSAALLLNGFDQNDPDGGRAQARRLEDEMEKIETALADRSAGFRVQLRPYTLEAVQAQIPTQAALIEFALYRPADAKALINRGPRYAAYVVPAKGQPRAIDLGDAAAIDRAVADLRQALRDAANNEVKRPARALDEVIMRPVRRLLGPTRELLVSPDGALNLAPFAALVDEQDRYLVEQFSITYLTSGRDLLRLQEREPSRQGALIIADPDFGARPAQPSRNTQTPSGAAALLAQADFTPLPGAAEEARALRELLPQATALTREQATETALKQAAAPRILHVATHGFFLSAEPEISATTRGQRLLLQQKSDGAIGVVSLTENPWLRSGLALAGVNARQSGADDGILTAYEAAALDLWGTKLVALSACDTGVGEVKNGAGVYGLRRALALTGAETLVMSLWSVSDQGTRDLMIEYYKALEAGQGRGEAMRQVQLRMLKSDNHRHPYFWASFIVSGEWANLDGKR